MVLPLVTLALLPSGCRVATVRRGEAGGEVTVESAALVFAEKKEPLGYVSDHIGLRARLSLTPAG